MVCSPGKSLEALAVTDRPAQGPGKLDKNVVLVTGASDLIGRDFCRRYAGTYEIVAVRDGHEKPASTAHRANSGPPAKDGAGSAPQAAPVYEIQADLRDRREHDRVLEIILERYGRIDGLVNLMEEASGRRSMLLENALADASYYFDVNAIAPIELAVQTTLKYWRYHPIENLERNRAVVNVSSAAGVSHRYRRTGAVLYSASKAALYRFSLHLADELDPLNVRVMTLAPMFRPLVSAGRVSVAIAAALEGDETASTLLMQQDQDRWLGDLTGLRIRRLEISEPPS
jgi:NAD(P)-dependent dehydrogenase (short-subunit alcohol dehydrogenase family)